MMVVPIGQCQVKAHIVSNKQKYRYLRFSEAHVNNAMYGTSLGHKSVYVFAGYDL